ncbi:uncharacterized protein [Eurosta solidaginis]|uniref:uncharacterized protein isoform X3 n=1 Tax=Eurosta solidaginis TaxID=178769 RepID=UPI0035308E18
MGQLIVPFLFDLIHQLQAYHHAVTLYVYMNKIFPWRNQTETYQEETASLRDQLSIVEQSLAERRVLIDKLSGMQSDQEVLLHRLEFPIYTEEDLANLNDEINDTNRDTYNQFQ